MHNKQIKLIESLSQYDLTKIIHHYDKSTINSTYNGQSILSLFVTDCLVKLTTKPSILTKFLGIYQKLIELGANPNIVNENTGMTSLHEAIAYGTNNTNKLVLEKLLEHCDINKPDFKQSTPFGYSLQFSNNIALDFLVQHKNFKITPQVIIEATKYCSDPVLLNKIFSSAEIHYRIIKNLDKQNLLHIALSSSNFSSVSLIIELGINPLEKDLYKKIPTDYLQGDLENFPLLKKYLHYYQLEQQYNTSPFKEKVKKI